MSTTPFVQYDYSEADIGNHSRLTKITYPDGYELDYNYATGVDDNISRFTSISDSTGTLESYAYQGEGTVLERNHAQPGLNLTTTLDDFGRISDFNWTNGSGSVSHYAYGYDAAGNRLYKEDLVNSGLSELYGYDNLYQLTSFARGTLNSTKDAITGTPDMEQSWNHDALGNWDDVTTNGVTEDRDSNAQNEYTDVDGNSPAHDANGNMITDQDGKQFVWDAWNRLVEVQDASSVTLKTYTYDALNRRVTDSDGTTTKNLYYSTSWQVLQEQVAGQVTQQFVWSPEYVDCLILRERDTDADGIVDERLWAVQDANFNTVALVDNSGNVVERYKYTPFGVATVMDASGTVLSGSTYGWVHLHQGLRFEETSGLYDNRFRWYSPTLGQFVSNDPLGFAAGDVNARRYVGNLPTTSLDFSGLEVYLVGRMVPDGRWRGMGTHYTAVIVSADGKTIVTYDGGGPNYPQSAGCPVPQRNYQQSLDYMKANFFDDKKGVYTFPLHDPNKGPKDSNKVFAVQTPPNMTWEEEAAALDNAFEHFRQIEYGYRWNNSNTYMNVLLNLARMRMKPCRTEESDPNFPLHIVMNEKTTKPIDALGWDYSGSPYGPNPNDVKDNKPTLNHLKTQGGPTWQKVDKK